MSTTSSLESKLAGLTLHEALSDKQATATVHGILSAADVQFDIKKISGANRTLFKELCGRTYSLCLCGQPSVTREKVAELGAAMPHITHFCANNTDFDLNCLSKLLLFRKLVRISLCHTKIWSSVGATFEAIVLHFTRYPELERLSVCDSRVTSIEKCRLVAALPNLHRLCEQPTGEVVFEHFLSMETTQQARLNAEYELHKSTQFQEFSASASFFQLAILSSSPSKFHAASIFETMRTQRHFDCSLVPATLYLPGNHPTYYDLKHTALLGHLFRELTLPKEKLSPKLFGELLLRFPKHEILHMGAQATHLTNSHLAHLLLLQHITELDLGNATELTDKGMYVLAEALCDGFLPNLKKLNLSGCTKLTPQCYTFTLYIEGLTLILSPVQLELRRQALAEKFGTKAAAKK